jgi:RimJ/RimL family protein N-acetyltransferase
METLESFIGAKKKELKISIRKVRLTDAEFIFRLRNDPEKLKFLKTNSSSMEEQKDWLKDYKLREADFSDLYFVFLHKNKRIGTIRFIKRDLTSFESGSWFFMDNIPFDLSIRGELFCKDLGFEFFNYDNCYFRVIKTNIQVLRYHKLFNPQCIKEDRDYYYFLLNKDAYLSNRSRIISYLGIN